MHIVLTVSCLVFVLISCSGPSLDLLEIQPSERQSDSRVSINVDPPANAAGRVAKVVRIRVGGLDAHKGVDDVFILRGEASARDRKSIEARRESKALAGRRLGTLGWVDSSSGNIMLAPTEPFEDGSVFSVAIRGTDVARSYDVETVSSWPYLLRLWPIQVRHSDPQGAFAIWCLEGNIAGPACDRAITHVLDPGHYDGTFEDGAFAGIGSDCVRWRPATGESVTPLVAPPTVELCDGRRALVDPRPFGISTAASKPHAASCNSNEVPFGPGCAHVSDDRVTITAGDEPSLLSTRAPAHVVAGPLDADHPLVLRPLTPRTTYQIPIAYVDTSGLEILDTVQFQTLERQSHVVINEVMAHPEGQEPAQEWIELYNDGVDAVSLDRWVLEDSGGTSSLPSFSLPPAHFALVVGSDFAARSAHDKPPAAGTALLRVSKLGSRGLSNIGELIRLRDPSGHVVSSVPAIATPKPGYSISRVFPDGWDGTPTSFTLCPDGGSPGSLNR